MPPKDPFERAENALHAHTGPAAVLDAAGWTLVRRHAAHVDQAGASGHRGAQRSIESHHTVHATAQARLNAKALAQIMAASATDDMLHQPLRGAVRPRHYIKGALIVIAAVCGHLIGRACGWLLGLALRRPFVLAGCLAVLASLITLLPPEEPEAPATFVAAPIREPLPEPWTAINRPIMTYAVHAPELERLARGYHARRHVSQAREDALTYGLFAGDGLYARIVMQRSSNGAPGGMQSHFIDTARRAAEAGLAVSRMAQATPVTTKFGSGEAADALLQEGNTERACLVFRLAAGETLLHISGWLCGTQARPADRSQLACLIDRLNLVSAADDHPLKALFAAAERRRDPGCSSSLITQAGRKLTWIDPNASAPPLRTIR